MTNLDDETFAAWWNESRRSIYDWLGARSQPLSEMYRGAGWLLSHPVPGWTRFVPHAVREIVNRLPAVVCGEQVLPGHLPYSSRVDAIAVMRSSTPVNVEEASALGSDVFVPVPIALWSAVEGLIEEHRGATGSNQERALQMLEAIAPDTGNTRQTLGIVAGNWTQVGRWAAGAAHNQVRTDEERDATEVQRQFEAMEQILLGVTRPFFANKDELDGILAAANTRTD